MRMTEVDWNNLALDSDMCQALMDHKINFWFLLNVGNFLNSR